MQKIKNPFICWLVLFAVAFRPVPSQAFAPLAVVAVGALIAATGVMVAGAGVYKPPTFAQANAAVDSITGDINRKVVVARAFGAGVSAGLRGFESSYTLDFQKAYDWIKGHPSDYPTLTPAATSATVPVPIISPPGVGNIFRTPDGVYHNITNVGTPSYVPNAAYASGTTEDQAIATLMSGQLDIGGRRYVNTSFTMMWYNFTSSIASDGRLLLNRWQVVISCNGTGSTTANPLPTSQADPKKFAPAYPNTQAGQDETDKIAAQNPAAIKNPPAAMTSEQISEASKEAAAQSAEATAQAAEAAAAADPNNTALQVAAQQAREAANQAAIAADAAKGELETTPDDPPKTDTPPPAGPAPDADLVIDFSPFLGLQDKAMSKFPFSMVSSLGSLFSGLTSAPVTPSMDVPMPWGMAPKQITLSHWDDFAGKWRMMIALFFHASCIYAIIRRYS